jgi:hypothetical protein
VPGAEANASGLGGAERLHPGRQARELAREIGGIKVIVAEEVKTAHQGEVIGLFIEEKIERGLSLAETIAEIKRQGGLVYVPHPFDRMHSVPDYEHLLEVVEEIDILEVFNPRVAFSAFNEEAERFAAKYRIVAGAGSDSHVAQGLGSVMIKLRDFDGAAEFLQAMRDADIVRKHKNLVYVQALKFLQTSGVRGGRSLAARGGPGSSGGKPGSRGGRKRPVGKSHGLMAVRVAEALRIALGGHVMVEVGVATAIGVRAPDVAWCSDEFLAAHPEEAPLASAPELCVEVVSASNALPKLREKAAAYVAAGAREAWIVFPRAQLVEVHGVEGMRATTSFPIDPATLFT